MPQGDRTTEAIAAPSLEIAILDVTGMKCAGCVRAVENELKQCQGVATATVNLAIEVATVEYESGALQPSTLATTLTEAGFPSQLRVSDSTLNPADPQNSDRLDFQAQRQIESQRQLWRLAMAIALLLLSGIGHLDQLGQLNLPVLSNLGFTNIWFHCGLATVALLIPGRSMLIDGWRGLRRNAPNMNTLVSMGTLTAYITSLVALLVPQLGWECFFDEPVMLVGFILLGRTLEQQARNRAASAFQSLLALQPKVARLMKGRSEQEKGEQREERGKQKEQGEPCNQNSYPDRSTLLTSDFIEIPADRVRLGEWLQVLPGDKVPVDGEVVIGQTTIDESMLTGEAIPVLKQPGDLVAAGTLNQTGTIALRATRTGKETTLAHIIALVEAAQTRKAPIQNLADTIAGYFTYGVMTIAFLTFLFWYLVGSQLWGDALMQIGQHAMSTGHTMSHSSLPTPHSSPFVLSLKLAIAVLVIACPCALGLATPTAILVGSGIGAERGLLIRGGDVLERVHQLDTVIFDKTGTLTTGKPIVTDCIVLESGQRSAVSGQQRECSYQPSAVSGQQTDSSSGAPHIGFPTQAPSLTLASSASSPASTDPFSPLHPFTPHTLLQLAASVESGTRHPLAIAIQQQAQQESLELLAARAFLTAPGLGVAAIVTLTETTVDVSVAIGTQAWLAQHGVTVNEAAKAAAQRLLQAGKTVVYVAVDGTLAGLIAVTDTLRPDAIETVAALKAIGLTVMLLTGDQLDSACAIAQPLALNPDHILASVLPEGKAQAIAALQAQGHKIAMVGDGINDSPALTQADVGIALHSGTDVAVETAGIVLMRDRLTDVVESIRLSHATFNKIRQNLFWAFAYNVLGIPLAAGLLVPNAGLLLSPAAAGAMMALSSVSVVSNSLLLYLTFPTSSRAENAR
ncbi:heavy metal translocating P-type ATPase [Leptolyngbya sp. FACHB-321]|uniref:heavy metal translocating P-type ATPase n=1 Tax=Leptolyngbya sp. FACHB-321 TaxID=2692807 RepID=UPI003220586D